VTASYSDVTAIAWRTEAIAAVSAPTAERIVSLPSSRPSGSAGSVEYGARICRRPSGD
jgi:hypothetical protein